MKGTVAPSSSNPIAAAACSGLAPISAAISIATRFRSAVISCSDSAKGAATIVATASQRQAMSPSRIFAPQKTIKGRGSVNTRRTRTSSDLADLGAQDFDIRWGLRRLDGTLDLRHVCYLFLGRSRHVPSLRLRLSGADTRGFPLTSDRIL
jgi:hypothetical protein